MERRTVSLQKIQCPECSVGLKSAAGFKIGQTVCCRKCETYFVVEEPAEDEEPEEEEKPKPKTATKKAVKAAVNEDEDDEEDERPKKKKKKRAADAGDEGWSYKNSPVRFVVISVLVAVLLVLAYFLYEKKKKEREDAAAYPATNTSATADRWVCARFAASRAGA